LWFKFQSTKIRQNLHQTGRFHYSIQKTQISPQFLYFCKSEIDIMTEPQEKVNYPQNFDIKLIIAAEIPQEEAKRNISKALSESKTVHSFVNVRSSGKGNYLSYCYNIDIESKEHLERTYALLRTIPGLKFAL
jgi:putative lipoic acid-binding regulatory protein